MSKIYPRAQLGETIVGRDDDGVTVTIEVWRDHYTHVRSWVRYARAGRAFHTTLFTGPARHKRLERELVEARKMMAASLAAGP